MKFRKEIEAYIANVDRLNPPRGAVAVTDTICVSELENTLRKAKGRFLSENRDTKDTNTGVGYNR